jgi:hypothetical protein
MIRALRSVLLLLSIIVREWCVTMFCMT